MNAKDASARSPSNIIWNIKWNFYDSETRIKEKWTIPTEKK